MLPTTYPTMPNVDALEKALYDARYNMSTIQRSLNDKNNEIVRFEAELIESEHSKNRSWHYHDNVAARLSEQDTLFRTLNAENETLKHHIATYQKGIHDAEVCLGLCMQDQVSRLRPPR